MRPSQIVNTRVHNLKIIETQIKLAKVIQSAICAVMLYDARLSQVFAAKMQEEGISATGFYSPVVPKEQARIRVQRSAAHTREQLDKCIAAFIKVGKELDVLK